MVSKGAKLIHVLFESSISAFVKGRSQTDVFVLGVFRGNARRERGRNEGVMRDEKVALRETAGSSGGQKRNKP